jgi:hypothetical protein
MLPSPPHYRKVKLVSTKEKCVNTLANLYHYAARVHLNWTSVLSSKNEMKFRFQSFVDRQQTIFFFSRFVHLVC